MRVSLVQTALHWEQPAANRATLTEQLHALQGQTDLVILPEMFTTGFTMQAAQLAEPLTGSTLDWLHDTARHLDAAVTGSFICVENGRYFNRLVWMFPDGRYEIYDKRHLFGLAGEHLYYTAGKKRLILEWRDWRICPLICYDLRFPIWSRNRHPGARAEKKPVYDLLIFVANWPERRSHHWRSLLTARSIENQAFTIGVNVVGQDGNGHQYVGDSTILDFAGQPVLPFSQEAGIRTAKLSLDDLQDYRRQLPFLADGDHFEVF